MFDFLTLDDVDVKGKSVFLRVDINSPLDPASKRILDDCEDKGDGGYPERPEGGEGCARCTPEPPG